MSKKKAFISGFTGQDGSYLTEFLLEKDYEVHAIVRRASVFTTKRVEHLLEHPDVKTYHGDLTDSSNLRKLLHSIVPDEVYNLGAQSHVGVSFEVPEYTAQVDGVGTLRLLDAVVDLENKPKFYQASTSELFGGVPGTAPQSENTAFYPKSPYGAAKLYAYWLTVNYREAYGLFACNGILFNHESPRRGETFVTRKITRAVARIHLGLQSKLTLGNLDAVRDWGYAGDYVESMWMMLNHEVPDDYVIATGQGKTVREFVELAFNCVNINIEWQGSGEHEKGFCEKSGRLLVEVNPKYFRPTEVEILIGSSAKAEKNLGWKPKTKFADLVKMMVESDISEARGGLA